MAMQLSISVQYGSNLMGEKDTFPTYVLWVKSNVIPENALGITFCSHFHSPAVKTMISFTCF